MSQRSETWAKSYVLLEGGEGGREGYGEGQRKKGKKERKEGKKQEKKRGGRQIKREGETERKNIFYDDNADGFKFIQLLLIEHLQCDGDSSRC